MYIVTGGLGFIGSYITMGLLSQGRKVLVVDRITEEKMRKFDRFASASYMDRDEFFSDPAEVVLDPKVEGVFHQGACSSTTHPDSKYVMENNYTKSIALIDACMKYDVPLVYASSAAVYGQGLVHYHFREDPSCETPLNVYGYSKLLVDRSIRSPDHERLSLRCPVGWASLLQRVWSR
jgi:ADP-L-glycero-D-manno-heptose 6-epimerase